MYSPPVSIHVPLAEHDLCRECLHLLRVVSIHVPLAEHDLLDAVLLVDVLRFNSRAPRGARRLAGFKFIRRDPVSIHVPLAEHDIRNNA